MKQFMKLEQWIYVITHLSKTADCTIPNVNANINYGLWVVVMRRFIKCSKCPPLVDSVDGGKGCDWAFGGGRADTGNLCTSP